VSVPIQHYLNFGTAEDWPFYNPNRVLLFSGGLDSLAGAVDTINKGEKCVLVSHRSVSSLDRRQQELYARLVDMFPAADILRIPVWINKTGGNRSREYTQRTRSFLFWALAIAVGVSVNAGGVNFFENGVVSLNLPIADQVLRARASRTTHPEALRMLEELAALVIGQPFAVDNPFAFLTKAEVVQKLIACDAGDLIRSSCSCSRTRMQRGVGWHCGCCSQCIDRRLAMIASGHAGLDPEVDYHTPVLTGARPEADRIMAFSYVRHATELARMSDEEISERFNAEISRAVRPYSNPTQAAQDFIDMHVRHGRAVREAITISVAAHAADIVDGKVPSTSMLGLIFRGEHLQTSWVQLATRISEILSHGIPSACQSRKPDNEVHLQEICDGLLRAADENLRREYPYLRWASRMTKPDWSDEGALLWIELKYIRKRYDVRRATEEIAADITKYRDSGRWVLFVIYDPDSLIIEQDEFISDIQRHQGVLAHVVK
jgi:hypothetical protein